MSFQELTADFTTHRISSLWHRFRWGFSLADLQACVDTIFFKWDAVVVEVECSYLNRRRYIRMCDKHWVQPPCSCMHLTHEGDVKLTPTRDFGDTVWIAHSKSHGKFYMVPSIREGGRLKELGSGC